MRSGTMGARLRKLGMDWVEYLDSDHWREVNRRFGESALPQCCIGCEGSGFHLAHRTYQRLGAEELTDLIPLCNECHARVRMFQKDDRFRTTQLHAVLSRVFGWSRQETAKKFEPYKLPGRPNGFSLSAKEA